MSLREHSKNAGFGIRWENKTQNKFRSGNKNRTGENRDIRMILFAAVLLAALFLAAAAVVVNSDQTTASDVGPDNYFYVGTGTEWWNKDSDSVFNDPYDAINAASYWSDANSSQAYVLVAVGMYSPQWSFSLQWGSSYSMADGVTIIGGFAGNEGGLTPTYQQNGTVDEDVNTVFWGSGASVFSNDGVGNTAVLQNAVIAGASDSGMYNFGSSPTITNCTFANNQIFDESMACGGGMYNENGSSPILTDCTFVNNQVTSEYNAYGGGMYNSGSNPILINCTFTNNQAGCVYNALGGGIYNQDSDPILIGCIFTGNQAYGNIDIAEGGGMYSYGGNPKLINCAFTDNQATGGTSNKGGGMYDYFSNPAVINCTFTNNQATGSIGQGAGIFGAYSNMTLINSIVVLNTADSDPDLYDDNNATLYVSVIGTTRYYTTATYDEDISPAPSAGDFNPDGSLTSNATWAIKAGDPGMYSQMLYDIGVLDALNHTFGVTFTEADMRDANGNLVLNSSSGAIDLGAFRYIGPGETEDEFNPVPPVPTVTAYSASQPYASGTLADAPVVISADIGDISGVEGYPDIPQSWIDGLSITVNGDPYTGPFTVTSSASFVFKCVSSSGMESSSVTMNVVINSAKPTVVSLTPSGTDVGVSGNLTITFSKRMNGVNGTVSLSNGKGTLTGGSWISSTVYSIPYSGLNYSTAYTVTVSGFADALSNVMVNDSSRGFTTCSQPMVVSLTPSGTDAGLSGTIVVTFNKGMNHAVNGSVSLNNGKGVLTGGSWTSSTVYSVPYSGLNYLTPYTATVSGFADTLGNVIGTDSTYGFTTCSQPTVVSLTPSGTDVGVSGAIVVTFSKAMDQATNGSVSLSNGKGLLTGGSWTSGSVYSIPYSGLNYSTAYTVTVSGFKDTLGNVIVNDSGHGFTTCSQPTIVTLTPSGTEITTSGTVVITFSKAMNGAVSGSVSLSNGKGTLTGGSWTSDTVYSVPYSGLTYSTTYTVTVSGFADTLGNAIVSDSSRSFTTSSQPTVVSLTPSGADVGLSGSIAITFSKAMNQAVNGSVSLNNGKGTLTGGSWTSSTVYSIPYSGLTYSTTYTVTISGFADTLGNAIVTDSSRSFTTTSQPTVVSVTPSGTNVGVNGTIVIVFSKAMAVNGPVSLNNGKGTLTGGSWTSSTVYSIPYSGLNYSTTYTVTVSGFADTLGNAIVTDSSRSFTTTSQPTVVSLTPSGTDVGLSGSIVITFSKAMNSAVAGSVSLNNGKGVLTGGSWTSSTVYSIPYSGLNYLTTYTVTVSGFADTLGNVIVTDSSNGFTTCSQPTVVSLTPSGTNVGISGTIVITFSKEMNHAVNGSVSLNNGKGVLTGGSWTSGNVYSVPYSGLNYLTAYTVTVSGFADTLGNVIGTNSSHGFTTAAAELPPTIVTLTPSGTEAGINSSVVITFGKAMNQAVNGSVSLNNGIGALTGGHWISSTVYSVEYSYLDYGTAYTVTVSGFADTSGNVMVNDSSHGFTTCSLPAIVTLTPSGTEAGVDGTIVITFSKAMDFATDGSVSLDNSIGALTGGSWTSSTVYSVDYSGLDYGTAYEIYVSGFADSMGNVMEADPSHSFTTSALPTVVSLTPSGTDVATSNTIVITFSKEMDENVAGSVSLNNGIGALTGGSWSSGNTVYSVPYSGLSYGTTYTITVSGFTDTFGNAMEYDSNHGFTTHSQPTVVSLTPSGTNVSISGTIVITFSKGMDHAVNGSVSLNNGIGALMGGSWASSAVFSVPYSGLDYGATYAVTVSGFADTSSVTMVNDSSHSFTTSTLPAVVTLTPSGTEVATSDTIVITFSKEMDHAVNGTVLLDNGIGALTSGSWTSSTVYSMPYNGLDYGTAYTVTVSGFADTLGNVMEDDSSHGFTTSTLPAIVTLTPSGTDAATSDTIVITFSKEMDHAVAGSVSLDNSIGELTGGSWTSSTVYSVEYSGLDYGTAYAITVSGFADTIGNTMENDSSHSFTTCTQPTIVTLTPSGTNAATSGMIVITFSKEMDVNIDGSVSLDNGIGALTGGSWSSGNTVYYVPYSGLDDETAYTVTVSGFTDTLGNVMEDDSSHGFTTAAADMLIIVSLTPSGTDAATSGTIVITFSKEMDHTVDGSVSLDNGIGSLTGGSWTSDTVYSVPYSGLEYDTMYTVTVSGFTDTSGSVMEDDSSHGFITSTQPVIVTLTPSGTDAATSGTIVITFNKEIDHAVAGSVSLDNGIGALAGGSWTSSTVYSVPHSGLDYGTTYTVTVSGFADTLGNVMEDDSSHGFTTYSLPAVVTLTPSGTDAATSGTIVITFSKEMDHAVDGIVSLDNGIGALTGGSWTSSTVYSVPYTGLDYGTAYVVTVSGFTDTLGNVMEDDSSHCFTIVAAEQPPTIVSLTPSGTNAATSDTIVITFSKEMDHAVDGNVSLDNGIGVLAGGSWTSSTVYSVPYSGLNYSTAYTITVSGFTDTLSNVMEDDSSHSFTTAAAELPPTIVTLTPSGTNVATSGTITITFSKEMDHALAGSVSLDNGKGVLTGGSWTSSTVYSVPYSGLDNSTTYTATVSGFTDTSGNIMEDDSSHGFTTAAAGQSFKSGDINDDGKVDSNDILWLTLAVAGFSIDYNHVAADVNKDGKIDSNDILWLTLIVAGMMAAPA